MLLFVGLGNPEPQYERNRHNIGFMLIDALAAHFNFAPFREKFKGLLSEGTIADEKILLLKPQTYMNVSGESVQVAAQFYKLEHEQMIIFHDEIDLPPAKLRMQKGGGSAGHNGIKSVATHIGAGFRRARLGVGRPVGAAAVANHVLSNFSDSDSAWLHGFLNALCQHAPLLVTGEDALYQTRIHEDVARLEI